QIKVFSQRALIPPQLSLNASAHIRAKQNQVQATFMMTCSNTVCGSIRKAGATISTPRLRNTSQRNRFQRPPKVPKSRLYLFGKESGLMSRSPGSTYLAAVNG